jgi:hypothetical protein
MAAMKRDMAGLQQSVTNNMNSIEESMKGQMSSLRSEIKTTNKNTNLKLDSLIQMFANFTNGNNERKRERQSTPEKTRSNKNDDENDQNPLQNIPFLNYISGGIARLHNNNNMDTDAVTDQNRTEYEDTMEISTGKNDYKDMREGNYTEEQGFYTSHSKVE